MRRAAVVTGALAVLTAGPIVAPGPATAEPDPGSTTQEFAAITADMHAPPIPTRLLPARQGLGDNPALTQLTERTRHAASRTATRTRTVLAKRVVAKATRAKVVKATAAVQGAGRHRAAPAARHRVTTPAVQRTTVARKTTTAKRKVTQARATRGMGAITAFARSKVGMRYVPGGTGRRGYDCSGLVMKAYQRIGRNLPHSSGGIAARARTVSRSQARPGDIVVGPGHVGIYMGRGMMIDAGNQRVGVSYRRMYRGLHIERL